MNSEDKISEEKKISEQKFCEKKMWCSHCGVETPIRREGKARTVKSCNWCGKILADETGTADEYNLLFLQYQAVQDLLSLEKGPQTIKKQ